MRPLLVGDTVELWGQSQSMTVVGTGTEAATCVWHDENGQHQEQAYPFESLCVVQFRTISADGTIQDPADCEY
jgi:hypothetical protein